MVKYHNLSEDVQKRILKDRNLETVKDPAIRRNPEKDKANLHRPAFVRDVEKIIHCPYYNRYTDKTQVFSFYKNDDISRRALHVQIVSRIARNIGALLCLDLDLIEAIALGHDIGHTPFGHAGEDILSAIYNAHTGRFFNHNVHSVRVLDKIFNYNISLQTLDGILCHNGELELKEYKPSGLKDFNDFDNKFEDCYIEKNASSHLIPSTMEGCVVRICDIIAYIGKDRQDALKTRVIETDDIFETGVIGNYNAAMINNLIVNIVENSYGKDYIKMDDSYFESLTKAKRDNYEHIYKSDAVGKKLAKIINPMFEKMYEKLLCDIKTMDKSSVIYKHHIEFLNNLNRFNKGYNYLEVTELNQIVTDFIASMTDDYFIDLYEYFFPKDDTISYISYFKDVE
ncbi:MAG: HD domain-containing protein [Clostridia bacterium]|nr:HD domain-containing protein [Clostridia bacterium]MBR6646748.1 HD domain-containing protein [Clostridia bacterium]